MAFKLLGVEFAPLNVPLARRLQTIAVFQWVMTFLFLGFGLTFLMIYLLFTRYWWFPLMYFPWYYYDKDCSSEGGRRFHFMRRLKLWHYFRDYFPIKLVKTAELDPNKNYICGYHPHGVLSAGAFCNFCTEATQFSKVFPGIIPYLLTLKGHFQFPLYRDYILLCGVCDVSKKSIDYILTQQGFGNAAIIVLGGAAEALDAHPGKYCLRTLSRRKGFVRLAFKHGASLVPIFSFGENDLFDQLNNPHGSKIRKIQDFLTKICGFSPPFFHGRGIFNYSFGLLPYRKPITTIVGKPIEVEQMDNPTEEQVNELHAKYMESLKQLFEENKAKHGDKNLDLTFS